MSGIENEPVVAQAQWGTSEMKAALTTIEGTIQPTAEAQTVTESGENGDTKAPPNGWVERTAYKYDDFTREAEHDWDSNAKVYEWDGEAGDVGPEHPALELDLFGPLENRISAGIDFSK
jgi:ATP-dependent RNA helicase DDX3X